MPVTTKPARQTGADAGTRVDPAGPAVLLVKISSLGDVLHALPAVTDAARTVPGIRIDWVVEESFAEIPAWHPGVRRVIPVASRRWRSRPQDLLRGDALRVLRAVRRERYARVIDAQGLMKSALFAVIARGPRSGLAGSAAREPLAALCYQHRYHVSRDLHAIDRLRVLLAASLDYEVPAADADYGIDRGRLPPVTPDDARLVLLHGTSWPSKQWPLEHWRELAQLATSRGFRVAVPWGNEEEKRRALAIVGATDGAQLLPPSNLGQLAALLAGAAGAVAVDTGLGHLAAAVGTPCVSLYGPTAPARTGTRGPHQRHLAAEFPCSPCMSRSCSYRGPSAVRPACYATLPAGVVMEALVAARAEAARREPTT